MMSTYPPIADRRPTPLTRLLHAALGVLAAFALSLPAGARAQSGAALDTDLVPAESGVLGEPQLIEADVGPDTEVADITLFHRFDGEDAYERRPMEPSGAPGIYAATVPTRGAKASRLEFHIVAEDAAGARLLKGTAAAPLVRELTPAPGATASAGGAASEPAPAPRESGRSGKMKYLYYGLGILAVGALAAAAADGGGGGGGGGGEGCAESGCVVTIVLPDPGR